MEPQQACVYMGCTNTSSNFNMFSFPHTEPERLYKWLQNCGDPRLLCLSKGDLPKIKVCSEHFSEEDFQCWFTKMSLLDKAVPVPRYNRSHLRANELLMPKKKEIAADTTQKPVNNSWVQDQKPQPENSTFRPVDQPLVVYDVDKTQHLELNSSGAVDHSVQDARDVQNRQHLVLNSSKAVNHTVEVNRNIEKPHQKRPDPVGATEELERFKRRLIRTVARLQAKGEVELWDRVAAIMGRPCKMLWERMNTLTLRKLVLLLEAGDVPEACPPSVRMTLTDWLMADLVLVHAHISVIGPRALVNYDELRPLVEMFHLVQLFKVEGCSMELLPHAWTRATAFYNERGKHCSPMLLQRRWYELKQSTRYHIMEYWQAMCRRSHWTSSTVAGALPRPAQLHIAIARRYPHVVTQSLPSWHELIACGRVVLPHQFEAIAQETSHSSEPDLVLIEPQLETIDLELCTDEEDSNLSTAEVLGSSESDSSEETTDLEEKTNVDEMINIREISAVDNKTNDEEYDMENEMIKKEITNSDNETKEKVVDSENLNVENSTNSTENTNPLKVEPEKPGAEIFESMTLLNTPIVSTVIFESDSDDDIAIANLNKVTGKNEVTGTGLNDTTCKVRSDKKSTIEKYDEVSNNGSGLGNKSEKGSSILHRNEKLTNSSTEESMSPASTDTSQSECEENNTVNSKVGQDDQLVSLASGKSSIDEKLIMMPVVQIKRLDDLKIFKSKIFIEPLILDKGMVDEIQADSMIIRKAAIDTCNDLADFHHNVKGKVLENPDNDPDPLVNIHRQSIDCLLVQQKKNGCPQHSGYQKTSMSEVDSSDKQQVDVKPPIEALPKVNIPLSLWKNPDFNTSLRKLTPGFLKNQLNRQLLKSCKPLTVDICKCDNIKQQGQVQPSDPPNSIINEMDVDVKDIRLSEPTLSNDPVIEVRKAKPIELPDIDNVRRINKNILTAEVAPIAITEGLSEPLTEQSPMHLAIYNDQGENNLNREADQECLNSELDYLKKVKSSRQGPYTLTPILKWSNRGPVITQRSLKLSSKARLEYAVPKRPLYWWQQGYTSGSKSQSLTLGTLKKILTDLTTKHAPEAPYESPSKSSLPDSIKVKKFCCLAKRHRAINDARRRLFNKKTTIVVKCKKTFYERQIHNHKSGVCKCCCAQLLEHNSENTDVSNAEAGASDDLEIDAETLDTELIKTMKGIKQGEIKTANAQEPLSSLEVVEKISLSTPCTTFVDEVPSTLIKLPINKDTLVTKSTDCSTQVSRSSASTKESLKCREQESKAEKTKKTVNKIKPKRKFNKKKRKRKVNQMKTKKSNEMFNKDKKGKSTKRRKLKEDTKVKDTNEAKTDTTVVFNCNKVVREQNKKQYYDELAEWNRQKTLATAVFGLKRPPVRTNIINQNVNSVDCNKSFDKGLSYKNISIAKKKLHEHLHNDSFLNCGLKLLESYGGQFGVKGPIDIESIELPIKDPTKLYILRIRPEQRPLHIGQCEVLLTTADIEFPNEVKFGTLGKQNNPTKNLELPLKNVEKSPKVNEKVFLNPTVTETIDLSDDEPMLVIDEKQSQKEHLVPVAYTSVHNQSYKTSTDQAINEVGLVTQNPNSDCGILEAHDSTTKISETDQRLNCAQSVEVSEIHDEDDHVMKLIIDETCIKGKELPISEHVELESNGTLIMPKPQQGFLRVKSFAKISHAENEDPKDNCRLRNLLEISGISSNIEVASNNDSESHNLTSNQIEIQSNSLIGPAPLIQTDIRKAITAPANIVNSLMSPDTIVVENVLYKKLYDDPLTYAQVLSTLENISQLEEVIKKNGKIFIYHYSSGELLPVIVLESPGTSELPLDIKRSSLRRSVAFFCPSRKAIRPSFMSKTEKNEKNLLFTNENNGESKRLDMTALNSPCSLLSAYRNNFSILNALRSHSLKILKRSISNSGSHNPSKRKRMQPMTVADDFESSDEEPIARKVTRNACQRVQFSE